MPKSHQAMTTEEFMRNEVFQQPTTNMSKKGIAQTGADDRADMTPDNAPKYQRTEFTTKKGTVFGAMELFRNDEGQITQCSTIFDTKKKVTEYSYDHKGRLIAVKTNGLLTEQYRYGSRGERLQELNGTRYVYNYSSQLEQMRTPKGSTTFVYDDKKRVVQKHGHSGVTAFSYNKYGLLEQVCLPDGRCITYTYDPLGRRSSKLVNGKVTEKYCWKDMLCLQAACTRKDEGHVVFNYPESERNVLQPTSLSCNGKKYFLAYNHVGTLLAIADESGSIVHIEETDSFGRRLSHHKLASVAMLSFGGGDVDVYGYCLDDPVNLVDPLGLQGKSNKSLGDMFNRARDTPAGRIVERSVTSAGKSVGKDFVKGLIFGGPVPATLNAGKSFLLGIMTNSLLEIPEVRKLEQKVLLEVENVQTFLEDWEGDFDD